MNQRSMPLWVVVIVIPLVFSLIFAYIATGIRKGLQCHQQNQKTSEAIQLIEQAGGKVATINSLHYLFPGVRWQRAEITKIDLSAKTTGKRKFPRSPELFELLEHNHHTFLFKLDVSGTDFNSSDLSALSESRLYDLIARNCRIAYAPDLKIPSRLRSINLDGNPVSNEFVEQLVPCRKLQSLWLSETEVSDGIIDILRRMNSPDFKYVGISGSPNVSREEQGRYRELLSEMHEKTLKRGRELLEPRPSPRSKKLP